MSKKIEIEIEILKLILEINKLEARLLSLSHAIALESNRCSNSKFLDALKLEYSKLNKELIELVEQKVIFRKK